MTQEHTPQFRPLPFLLMVLVLTGVAVGGWWLKTNSGNAVSTANTASVLPPASSRSGNIRQENQVTLYLPNDNAMLEKQSAPFAGEAEKDFANQAQAAFRLLQQKSPDNFPSGTQLLNVETSDNGLAKLNFNQNFTDTKFWQGSAQTTMSIYSIVNTVTALHAPDFQAKQVQFLVEGRPVEVLGEFDAHDPFQPDTQWVAQP